jgi:hypothetical protein
MALQKEERNDAPIVSIRYVMGLKKPRDFLVRARPAKRRSLQKISSSQFAAQSAKRKALGFFGHVTWQASGWLETVRALARRTKLQRRQPRIHPALRDQRVMRADFDQFAFVQHGDAVCFLDRGQAVRDDEGGAALHGAL